MSLTELVKFNDQRLSDAEVTDLLEESPLMQVATAIPASNGTNHRYKKQTTASSVGFRTIEGGVTKTKSAHTQVDVTLKILDASFRTDVAEAQGYRGGWREYLDMELMKSLKQAMYQMEAQVLNGTGNNASGFAGLPDDTSAGGSGQLNAVADAMVYSAGGTDTNSQSSVYAVRFGANDVAVVAGNDGNITFNTEDEPSIIEVTDTGTATYPAYYVPVTGWAGMQIGSAQSAGRIVNVGEDTTASLTDDMIAELLALFPSNKMPTHLVMNRTLRKQLQQSRTATNPTGAPAPFPTEAFNVPIITSDAIADSEAVVA